MMKSDKFFTVTISAFLLSIFLFYPSSVTKAFDAPIVKDDPTTGAVIIVDNETTETGGATDIPCGWSNIGGCFIKAFAEFLEFINSIISTLIRVVASVMNYVVRLTTFANNPAIIIGWTVMRDFANMFFILIMLWISILIILDLQGDAPNKLLAWVIIIAVLINFSRVIAFVVIDFSHVFLIAFLNAFPNNDIAGALAGGMQLNKLTITASSSQIASSAQAANSNWGILGTIFFHTILLVVILAAMIAGTLLFIGRILALWFLVMVAPIAFIGRILPSTIKSMTWDKWWPNLIKWSFVAPIYMFFIYITVRIVSSGAFASLINTNQTPAALGLFNTNDTPFVSDLTIASLLTMVIVVGFLLLGLKMSLGMAGAVGSSAMTLGTKAMGAVGGGIAWGTRKGAAWAGRKTQEAYKKHAEGLPEGQRPNFAYTFATGLMARGTAGAQIRERQDVEDRKEELKKKYGDNIIALQNKLLTTKLRVGPIGNKERDAIISRLGELKGGLESEDPLMQNEMRQAAAGAARRGFAPKSRPDLAAMSAPNPQEALDKSFEKIRAKEKDLENLSVETFSGDLGATATDAMIKKFSGAHMAALFRVNDEVFEHFRSSLLAMGKTAEQIENQINTLTANPNSGWKAGDGKKIISYLKSNAGQDAIFGSTI